MVGQPPLCSAVPTPQSEPLNERQVPNSVGGHAFPVDDMTRLQRFLILGSEGGSYYADERKLILDNVKAVKRCITASEESGINAVTEIARISKSRRAAKPGPGLFALAMAASYGSNKVRKTTFDFLNDVALTGSHLQMFIDYIGPMRGWGRGLRKAIGNWYTQRPLKDAVYQTVKSRVPGSGVRGRGSGERETTASSLAGKDESSRKEDNSGQGKDGPAGAIAQGGNGQ